MCICVICIYTLLLSVLPISFDRILTIGSIAWCSCYVLCIYSIHDGFAVCSHSWIQIYKGQCKRAKDKERKLVSTKFQTANEGMAPWSVVDILLLLRQPVARWLLYVSVCVCFPSSIIATLPRDSLYSM